MKVSKNKWFKRKLKGKPFLQFSKEIFKNKKAHKIVIKETRVPFLGFLVSLTLVNDNLRIA